MESLLETSKPFKLKRPKHGMEEGAGFRAWFKARIMLRQFNMFICTFKAVNDLHLLVHLLKSSTDDFLQAPTPLEAREVVTRDRDVSCEYGSSVEIPPGDASTLDTTFDGITAWERSLVLLDLGEVFLLFLALAWACFKWDAFRLVAVSPPPMASFNECFTTVSNYFMVSHLEWPMGTEGGMLIF